MDKLDAKIDEKRRLIAELKRQLEVEAVSLAALEEASNLRPASKNAPILAWKSKMRSVHKPKGRVPGSISSKWRIALGDMAKHGNPYRTIDEIFLVVQTKLDLAEASIRERVRIYADKGILEEQAGRYRVSESTIEKYKLDLRIMKDPASSELAGSEWNGTEASG